MQLHYDLFVWLYYSPTKVENIAIIKKKNAKWRNKPERAFNHHRRAWFVCLFTKLSCIQNSGLYTAYLPYFEFILYTFFSTVAFLISGSKVTSGAGTSYLFIHL